MTPVFCIFPVLCSPDSEIPRTQGAYPQVPFGGIKGKTAINAFLDKGEQ